MASNVPLHFLKTIEDIDINLIPLIERHELNLLLLSYLNYDVTKVPSLIFIMAILDFLTLSKRCKAVKTYFSLQIC